MIACRLLLQKNYALRMKYMRFLPFSTQASPQVVNVATSYQTRLPDVTPKQPQKEPFVKNLLLGIFDNDMLAYPEPHPYERNKSFFEWLKPIEEFMRTVDATAIDRDQEIPPKVLEKLYELGALGSKVPEKYGGMGLLESEMLKVIETLSVVPAIALHLIKISKCVNLIDRFGSEEVKLELLPQIAKGTLVPTICMSEEKTEDKKLIQMMAIASQDDKFWLLNGSKIFVPFAHRANLFLIFCNCMYNNDPFATDSNLSVLYMIEPECVSLEHVETVGMRGLKHFNVKFGEVAIPIKNMIANIGDGKRMHMDVLSTYKYYIGGVAIGILRNFADQLTNFMTHNVHMNKVFHEHEASKNVLGKTTHSLFAMESMAYMTTSLIDLYKDQDVSTESALVETFCASECLNRILEGSYLVGTPAYLKKNPYELMFRDAQALTLFEMSVIDSQLLSVLLGLAHVGKVCGDAIFKMRNPFTYPGFNFIDVFFERKLKLETGYHMHPTLYNTSKLLEMSISYLKKANNKVLFRFGEKVSEGHMDLLRLYEMMSSIYSLIAVVSRTSRSYCDGWRHAQEDLTVSFALAYRTKQRCHQLYQEIEDGEWINGDKALKDTTKVTLKDKGYYASHPLTNNFGP